MADEPTFAERTDRNAAALSLELIGRAELTHAKAFFPDGAMDTGDFGRIIDMAEAAGYQGPYTLIFENDSPGEWAALAAEREFLSERVG